MSVIASHTNYIAAIVLMVGGLFIVFSSRNLIKRMIGLAVFQGATGLFYISLGKVTGGTAPILIEGEASVVYSNPLPQVLILTAIVVGVATLSVGLAIAVRIREAYGIIESDEIAKADADAEASP